MLTGPQLGQAIERAIRLKGVPKTAVAKHFKIKGPSIYDWIDHGRVGKQHLEELVAYFSDVVGPAHWGLSGPSLASQAERLTGQMILAAYQEAKAKYAITGMSETTFRPLQNAEHAELFALSIIGQLSEKDSAKQSHVDVEVGHGSKRKVATRSGSAGEHRQEEARKENPTATGVKRKRA